MKKNEDILESNFIETPQRRTIKTKKPTREPLRATVVRIAQVFWRVLMFVEFCLLALVVVKLVDSEGLVNHLLAIPVGVVNIFLVIKYWIR